MNTNPARKEKYIRITSQILAEEGVEGVTIRKVADRAHCTSAVLYKHFANKEHLIMLGSIPFLEPYIIEFLEQNAREDLSSVQLDLLLWKLFINEAFRNRPYYELMFFGENREVLEDCVYEYYQLFPDVRRKFDGLTASVIFSGDLAERERYRLRRGASAGELTMENADLLSQLTVAVFSGCFIRQGASLAEEGDIQDVVNHCYSLIRALFEKFVNPGVKLEEEGG